MERRIFLIVGLDSTLNGISNVAPKTYQTILTSFSASPWRRRPGIRTDLEGQNSREIHSGRLDVDLEVQPRTSSGGVGNYFPARRASCAIA